METTGTLTIDLFPLWIQPSGENQQAQTSNKVGYFPPFTGKLQCQTVALRQIFRPRCIQGCWPTLPKRIMAPSFRLRSIPILDAVHMVRVESLDGNTCITVQQVQQDGHLSTCIWSGVSLSVSWFAFAAMLFLQGLFRVLLCGVFSCLGTICSFTRFDVGALHDLDNFRWRPQGTHSYCLKRVLCTGSVIRWDNTREQRRWRRLLFAIASGVSINRGVKVDQRPGKVLGTSSKGIRIFRTKRLFIQLNTGILSSVLAERLFSKICGIYSIKKWKLSDDKSN